MGGISKCPKCHARLGETWRFCLKCGVEIIGSQGEVHSRGTAFESVPYASNTGKKPPVGYSSSIFIASISIIAVLAVIGFVNLVISNNPDSNTESELKGQILPVPASAETSPSQMPSESKLDVPANKISCFPGDTKPICYGQNGQLGMYRLEASKSEILDCATNLDAPCAWFQKYLIPNRNSFGINAGVLLAPLIDYGLCDHITPDIGSSSTSESAQCMLSNENDAVFCWTDDPTIFRVVAAKENGSSMGLAGDGWVMTITSTYQDPERLLMDIQKVIGGDIWKWGM